MTNCNLYKGETEHEYKGYQIEISENSDQHSELTHEYIISVNFEIVGSGLAISANAALAAAKSDIDQGIM